MQKISNLTDKHLIAYARYLKSRGCSDKYIKTDLSGLRYMHSLTPNARHILSESREINLLAGLGSTKNETVNEVDRAWSREELDAMKLIALNMGFPNISWMMEASYLTGMRLDEAASLRRHEVERALRENKLFLRNTKGGRPRSVDLTDQSRLVLAEATRNIPRGELVFCTPGRKVHSFKKDVEEFIAENRDFTQEPDRAESAVNCGGSQGIRSALNFHGLRYSFAQNLYTYLRDQGLDEDEARQKVAEALGHGRKEITDVYF